MTDIIPGLQGDLPANSRKGVPFVAGKYVSLSVFASSSFPWFRLIPFLRRKTKKQSKEYFIKKKKKKTEWRLSDKLLDKHKTLMRRPHDRWDLVILESMSLNSFAWKFSAKLGKFGFDDVRINMINPYLLVTTYNWSYHSPAQFLSWQWPLASSDIVHLWVKYNSTVQVGSITLVSLYGIVWIS